MDGNREPMLFQGVFRASLTSTHGEILQDVGLEFQQMLLGGYNSFHKFSRSILKFSRHSIISPLTIVPSSLFILPHTFQEKKQFWVPFCVSDNT